MQLPFSEACERNKQPILDVLKQVLPGRGSVLEIGSCTGQHVVFFAGGMPGLTWQPSDQAQYLEGLAARLEAEPRENVLGPLVLDVTAEWPAVRYDAVFSANTAHIMGWTEVRAMFRGVGRCLRPGGAFCLYGPFLHEGRHTASSNEAFDCSLRMRDSRMGLRDSRDLASLAVRHQLSFEQRFRLPANNELLLFRRERDDS